MLLTHKNTLLDTHLLCFLPFQEAQGALRDVKHTGKFSFLKLVLCCDSSFLVTGECFKNFYLRLNELATRAVNG